MKKNIALVTFLLIQFSLFSQEIFNGKITYAVYVEPDKKIHNKFMNDSNETQQRKNTLNALFHSTKEVSCILEFTDKESLYKVLDTKDEEGTRLSRMIAGKKSLYYSNFEEDFHFYTFFDSQTNESLLISYNPMQWKLTNETKMIQGFLCHKAIEINDDKKKKQIAIAWYTKDLPYEIGPKDYGGLPGVILQINENARRFMVKKIELNLPRLRIAPPLEGRGITRKEFYDRYKNFFKN